MSEITDLQRQVARLEERLARVEASGALCGSVSIMPDSTNTVVNALRLERKSTGTAANGIGVGVTMHLPDASGNIDEVANMDAVLTTAAHATQAAEVRLGVLGATALALKSGYQGYIYVPLTTPLTSTSWDGDAYASQATGTQIDLSAVFGVPAGVKAVLVRLECWDSGSAANAVYVALGPSTSYAYQVINRPPGGDLKRSVMEVCNCDANGDIWYRIGASSGSSMKILIEIWGYWI